MMKNQIPVTWKRIEVGAARFTPGVFRTGDVVLPTILRSPGLPLEMSGLMPNRDHNSDLSAAIDLIPKCLSGETPVIGIFAADPFLRVDQMSEKLAEKGYTQITNLPSVTQYGDEFGAVLDDLDVGAAREYRTLKEFHQRGFSVSTAITSARQIPAALNLEPQHLFVVPSFDDWRQRGIDPDMLLGSCREIARERDIQAPDVPLVLFVGRLAISLTRAQDAGADAVLVD